MKILLLTDGIYPYQIGGMQKHSYSLIRYLASQNISLHVIHFGGQNYTQHNFVQNFEESIHSLSEEKIDFPNFFKLPGHYMLENYYYSKACYQAVKDRLETFDLVYSQGFTGWYFTKMRKKLKKGPPIVVNFHGFGEFQKAPNFKTNLQYFLLRPFVKKIINRADFVYSFGGKIDAIILSLGVSKHKLLTQSNGIEETSLKDTVKNNVIINFIYIGRYERRKGILELEETLDELLQNNSANFKFHFVGPIDHKNKLTHPNVIYHGEIRDAQQMFEIIDNCDCLVCPSYAEGMPTVILEAMARGLAIIATDVGATSRMIDGNGKLLDKPDVNALIIAMKTIISLPEAELMRMKLKSIEIVKEKFTWSQVIQSKIKDFEKIIKKN